MFIALMIKIDNLLDHESIKTAFNAALSTINATKKTCLESINALPLEDKGKIDADMLLLTVVAYLAADLIYFLAEDCEYGHEKARSTFIELTFTHLSLLELAVKGSRVTN